MTTSAITYPEQSSLKLHTSIAFGEPMGSSAINKVFHNIANHGIYEGFEIELAGGMDVVIAGSGQHTAVARHDDVSLTIHGQNPHTITLTAGQAGVIAINSSYAYGVQTKQVSTVATIEAAEYVILANLNQAASHHVIIAEFTIPSGTTELNESMFSVVNRSVGGLELEPHIHAYNPHPEYDIRVNDMIAAAIPAASPLPWPTDVAPEGFSIMKGQGFDVLVYTELAKGYPSGVLDDMRGLAIVGKKDGEVILAYEADEVKSHSHTGDVYSKDLGSKYTDYSGEHTHSVSLSYSRAGAGTARTGAGAERTGTTGSEGSHRHSVEIGSHDHGLLINAFGNTENTIKNRKYNWIVRLA